jgi:hypothetical protein
LPQGIDDPPEQPLSHRHRGRLSGPEDGGTRLYAFFRSVEHTTNDLAVQIEDLPLYPVGKHHDFVNRCFIKPRDQGNSVSYLLYTTKILDLWMKLHVTGLLFETGKRLPEVVFPCHALPLLLTNLLWLA